MYYYRGLYDFKIISEKEGKYVSINKLDYYKKYECYHDLTSLNINKQINDLLKAHLAKFNIRRKSCLLATHIRNGNPAISYSIRTTESNPMLTFNFDLTIMQSNGWIIRASGNGHGYWHNWNCEKYLDAQEEATKIATMCREHIMAYCWNPLKPLGQYLIRKEMEEVDLVAKD